MIEEIKQSTLAMFEATVMGANKESKDFSSSNEYLMVCGLDLLMSKSLLSFH